MMDGFPSESYVRLQTKQVADGVGTTIAELSRVEAILCTGRWPGSGLSVHVLVLARTVCMSTFGLYESETERNVTSGMSIARYHHAATCCFDFHTQYSRL